MAQHRIELSRELMSQLERYGETVRANRGTLQSRLLTSWGPYAAALGSSMALATSSDAGIVYSGTQNLTIAENFGAGEVGTSSPRTGVKMRLAHDNVDNFKLWMYFRRTKFGATTDLAALIGTNHSRMMLNKSNRLKRLAFGATISAGKTFGTGTRGMVQVVAGKGVVHGRSGTWPKSETGFAGVRFYTATGKKTLNGWIRLEWSDPTNSPQSFPTQLTAIDWAYDSTGAAIKAGDEGTSSVPEPKSLALLAVGAAGVLALRKARARTSPAENEMQAAAGSPA